MSAWSRHLQLSMLLTLGCTQSSTPTPSGSTAAPRASSSVAVAPTLPSTKVSIAPELLAQGRVRIGPVERRARADSSSFVGEVRASSSGRAEAGALVSGRVASIEVEVGTTVTKGQVLATMDAPEVARAVAEVLRARARAEVAGRKLTRQLELLQQEATSKNAVDEARLDERVTQADLAAARTLLHGLGGGEPVGDQVGARVAIRSPLAGVVSVRHAILGASVSADRPLFEITAKDAVHVLVRVPETTAMPTMRTASIVPRQGSLQARCQGEVLGELGVVDESTRTRSIRLAPASSCQGLSAGGFVSVSFAANVETNQDEQTVVIPSGAVVDVHGAAAVFLADETPGTFTARGVLLGDVGGVDTVVLSGLTQGQRVAVEGAPLLRAEMLRGELEGK